MKTEYIGLDKISSKIPIFFRDKLSSAVLRAEELIEDGKETKIYIMKVIDNSKANQKDYSQPEKIREFVCEVTA